jgi:integrase/recombinase XerD
MTPLRSRMIEDMELKNLSTRTINAYVSRVSNFARHFGRSPEHLGRNDVRSYLLHLIQEKKVSWSVYNQTLAALRFLYQVTLGRRNVLERIPFPSSPSGSPSSSAPTKSPDSLRPWATSSTAPSS